MRLQTTYIKRKDKSLLWPRKGSLMKMQTRILDKKLYYTRKIELLRKVSDNTDIDLPRWQWNLSTNNGEKSALW